MERLHKFKNIILTGVYRPRITLLLSQTAMVKICKQSESISWLRYIIIFFLCTCVQLFTLSIRYSRFLCYIQCTITYYEFFTTVYPAYIVVNYHECMFFVCETLYINVCIQTGNKNTEKNENCQDLLLS